MEYNKIERESVPLNVRTHKRRRIEWIVEQINVWMENGLLEMKLSLVSFCVDGERGRRAGMSSRFESHKRSFMMQFVGLVCYGRQL